MTYEESYMQCKDLEELEERVNHDVNVACIIDTDRINVIKESAEKVANLKFKGDNK